MGIIGRSKWPLKDPDKDGVDRQAPGFHNREGSTSCKAERCQSFGVKIDSVDLEFRVWGLGFRAEGLVPETLCSAPSTLPGSEQDEGSMTFASSLTVPFQR